MPGGRGPVRVLHVAWRLVQPSAKVFRILCARSRYRIVIALLQLPDTRGGGNRLPPRAEYASNASAASSFLRSHTHLRSRSKQTARSVCRGATYQSILLHHRLIRFHSSSLQATQDPMNCARQMASLFPAKAETSSDPVFDKNSGRADNRRM